MLKTVTLELKNVPACCCEELMSNLSTALLTCASQPNKPFQHQVECQINNGRFKYKFEVDDTSDVEKADQQCFDLGL
jgi:hypothetical protein